MSATLWPLEMKASTTCYKFLQSWDTMKFTYPNQSTLSMILSTLMLSILWRLQMKTSTTCDNFLQIWKTIKSTVRPECGRYWFVSASLSSWTRWYFGPLGLWAMLKEQDEMWWKKTQVWELHRTQWDLLLQSQSTCEVSWWPSVSSIVGSKALISESISTKK